MSTSPAQPMPPRALELVEQLGLQPHPEGGFFAEIFRSGDGVQPAAGATRSAMTSIDFLLVRGQCSAWHRVDADEAWHLLEGGPLRLWLMPPSLDAVQEVVLDTAGPHGRRPRHVVPAQWWQAAEPLGDFAYVGATVAPGFEFSGFAFGRHDAALREALPGALQRLL